MGTSSFESNVKVLPTTSPPIRSANSSETMAYNGRLRHSFASPASMGRGNTSKRLLSAKAKAAFSFDRVSVIVNGPFEKPV